MTMAMAMAMPTKFNEQQSTAAATTTATTAVQQQLHSTKQRINTTPMPAITTTTTTATIDTEKITTTNNLRIKIQQQSQIFKMPRAHLAKTHTTPAGTTCTQTNNNSTESSSSTVARRTLWLLLLLLCTLTAPCGVAARAATAAAASASMSALLLDPFEEQLLNATTALRSSIESNSIQRQFDAALGAAAAGAGGDHSRALKRVYLSNRNITCNDGSQAGFYLRKNPNSKKWIVFLEGGWHCYDTRSCRARWLRLRHLMTSAQWPETRDVGGILSPMAEENPYWHNANHVLVPYCSSDSWSGTRATPETLDSWRFMGALILRQVVADLIPLGLGRTTSGGAGAELLLVGSSAGALGVMLNLDRISDFLQNERHLTVTVRGVSDSGWFLDREPYTPAAVGSSESVRQGWRLWQGQVPEECAKQHTAEPWRCYFGYRLYPTLKTPLFVFQWLFDEAQMRADNVGTPVTPQQWNYIHEMGGALRSSLDNVTAVFAPSCISHAVLSKRDWVNIKIDDISLPAALRCWEHSTRPRRKRHDKLKRSTEATTLQQQQQQQQQQKQQRRRHQHRNQRRQQQQQQQPQHQRHASGRKENSVAPAAADNAQPPQHKGPRQRLTKAQREERRRLRHEQQQLRREQRRNRRNRKRNQVAEVNANELPEQHNRKRNSNNNNNNKHDSSGHKRMRQATRKNARRRNDQIAIEPQQEQPMSPMPPTPPQTAAPSAAPLSAASTSQASLSGSSATTTTLSSTTTTTTTATNRSRAHIPRVPERCALRLLERCSWPQCNHSCPTLTNPITGEEMRFLELLTSFGLDIVAVAAALGVDMHTLNNMDRTELVNLLTQQVS